MNYGSKFVPRLLDRHRLRGIAAALLVAMPAVSASANGLSIAKGRLVSEGLYAIQTVAIKNTTSAPLRFLEVECGFFRNGVLLTSGIGNTTDIGTNQTAYFDVQARHAAGADSTDCRISAAQ